RLLELAEHDVGRLEVAVDDPPAVGVSDGVAHGDEPVQQAAQGEAPLAGVAALLIRLVEDGDGIVERGALDEAHGVAGPAAVVLPKAVEGADPRVAQPGGDLRLAEEVAAQLGLIRESFLDPLQGDLALQLAVLGDVPLAEAAAGVEPPGTEPPL